ncbi:nucleotide-binding universal stress UspA family protein [Pseudonocardia hierapolitana]|uniref:Nucleotide-binding universal stress UspA family protein n=1 Tax=Pseudonocardia hierapolitana TaxID=1128676 RepID=A0A561SJ97_9PSEU|nr:universal stress protein [Pseudonocardia hierapolitana]TWF74957.1 nucleotide-binding universal stress UspA family protein [Pseudonocardia hierapolitana]
MLKKVIWATDGSPTAEKVYPVAKGLAESGGAKLIVAHAGEMVGSDRAGVFVDSAETMRATLERTADDLKRAGLDVELALLTASQRNASQMIADLAQETGADIVVVANRGHGPVASIFIGSFTLRLLQVAPCPVLVVPAGRQRTA